MSMRVFGQAGTVLLLLLVAFAPAMACAVPDAQLTPVENACCRVMKSQCGQTQMPASHGCCHKTIGNASRKVLAVKTISVQHTLDAVTILPAFNLQQLLAPSPSWFEQDEYLPPSSPPVAISVLRI
jgi:hypothetical protein